MSTASQDTSVFLLCKAYTKIPGRPHKNTPRRWADRGVRNIRLRTWLIGGRRYTSAEAIRDFLDAINSDQAAFDPPPRLDAQLARVNEELDALGIGTIARDGASVILANRQSVDSQ